MATLYESLGHTAWVNLREAIGAPVDPLLAAALPHPPETIAERDARRASEAADEARIERLAEKNRAAMARVLNAGRNPQVVSAEVVTPEQQKWLSALFGAVDDDEDLFGPITTFDL